jgi:mono/diheme cytochrome c family protein
MTHLTCRSVIGIAVVLAAAAGQARAQAPDGADLYTRSCAQCHDSGENRAPLRDAFLSMPAERVMASMETGSMITMALNRTAGERRAIAAFLSG